MTNRSWHLFSFSVALALAGNAAFAQSNDATSSAAPPVERRCRQRVAIPIGGQLGPDGAWHGARGPVPPPVIGGGPCEPEESSAPPAEETAASHAPGDHAAPTSASSVREMHSASITPATPPPEHVHPPVTPVASAPVAVTPAPAATTAPVMARGGGPYVGYAADVYMPPAPRARRVARLILGGGVGTGLYTLHSDALDLGLAWHADVGVEFVKIVSFEARYQGASNQVPVSIDPNRGYGIINNGVSALARLAIPIPFVRPFVQGGVGYLWFSTTGTAMAAPQHVFPMALGEVPVGGGIEIRPLPAFGVDLEYMYQFLVDDRWKFDQTAHPWGDLWSATGSLRFYL